MQHVVILGSSHVARLEKLVVNKKIHINPAIRGTTVSFVGAGGMSFAQFMSSRGTDMQNRVRDEKPDITVLVMGANDLDQPTGPAVATVIESALAVIQWLHSIGSTVAVMPLFLRRKGFRGGKHPGRGDYADMYENFNSFLSETLQSSGCAAYGRFVPLTEGDLQDDGVHLNDHGMGVGADKIYKS